VTINTFAGFIVPNGVIIKGSIDGNWLTACITIT
jgi:hypothetical protein